MSKAKALMRLWPQPPQRFQWVQHGDTWHLQPSPITVRPEGDYWTIYLHDRPLYARYTGVGPAKREAWLYAYQHRRAYFGSYRIVLEEER